MSASYPANLKRHPISGRAIAAFALSLLVCASFIVFTVARKSELQKLSMERLIIDKGIQITETITKLLYKTQGLAALVIQSNGEVTNFERSAAAMIDNAAILNILLAPDGVVSHVYPLQGNGKLIGYNLLGEGAGNREAVLAKEKSDLVFGGPFPLMQGGGQALVGRYPVWLEKSPGHKQFWGLVSVTLKYPQVLNGAGLHNLQKDGYAYEVWRINPDTNKRQVIAGTNNYSANTPYIEKQLRLLNADWFFRILPVRLWYEYADNWMLIAAGLGLSLLVGIMVQSNRNLKAVKEELENTIRFDAVTGLLNRIGFYQKVNSLIGGKTPFRLYCFDVNYFKKINFMYGRRAGDAVLKELCDLLEPHVTKDHVFARIDGDELAIATPEEIRLEEGEKNLSAVIQALDKTVQIDKNRSIPLSFCSGMAQFPDDGETVDKLLAHAEREMLTRKRQMYEENRLRTMANTLLKDDQGALKEEPALPPPG